MKIYIFAVIAIQIIEELRKYMKGSYRYFVPYESLKKMKINVMFKMKGPTLTYKWMCTHSLRTVIIVSF